MAEYTNTIQLNGKVVKVVVVALVVGLAAFGVYAHATGKNLHIKTGVINGTNANVTEYLDGQDYIQGKVVTIIPLTAGGRYVLMGSGVGIDISPVLQAKNRVYPLDHYVKGEITTGVTIHAVARKVAITPQAERYSIAHLYEIPPYDPFYIAVQ